MHRARRHAVALALAGIASLAVTATAAAGVRHAVPTGGSGTACTSAAPCDIFQAVGFANNGDEVILAPGDYTLGASTLSLTVGATVHGTPGESRPRLLSSAPAGAVGVSGTGAVLSDVRIESSGFTAVSIGDGATLDRVYATDSATNGFACIGAATPPATAVIRNSVCRATGLNSVGYAVLASSSGPGRFVLAAKLANVTAIAPSAGSYGIFRERGLLRRRDDRRPQRDRSGRRL